MSACAAYAWINVLCMSCYAISTSNPSVAAFLCRQHNRFFPFHIPGFALTPDIYSVMSLTAET